MSINPVTHKEVKNEADVPAGIWWVIQEFKRFVKEQGAPEIVKVAFGYEGTHPQLMFQDQTGASILVTLRPDQFPLDERFS